MPAPHFSAQLPPVDPHVPGAGLVARASRVASTILVVTAIGVSIAAVTVRVEDTVQVTGFLEPTAATDIRVREPGIVAAVLVRTGDSVHAGAPLLELDSTEAQFELERARDQERSSRLAGELADSSDALKISAQIADSVEAAARYEESRLQFAEAATEFGVRGPLDSVLAHYRAGGHVGMDRAFSRVQSAQAALSQAGLAIRAARLARGTASGERVADLHRLELTTRELEQKLADHLIRAPYDGVIQTERPDLLVGRTVATGDAVLSLAQRSSWRARGWLPADRAAQVQIGAHTALELPTSEAFTRRLIEGRVGHIGIELGAPTGAQAAGLGIGVPVMIEVEDSSIDPSTRPSLRAGLNLRVSITTRTQSLGQMLWRILRGDDHRTSG